MKQLPQNVLGSAAGGLIRDSNEQMISEWGGGDWSTSFFEQFQFDAQGCNAFNQNVSPCAQSPTASCTNTLTLTTTVNSPSFSVTVGLVPSTTYNSGSSTTTVTNSSTCNMPPR